VNRRFPITGEELKKKNGRGVVEWRGIAITFGTWRVNGYELDFGRTTQIAAAVRAPLKESIT